jgi:uncharacterized protein YjbJ (UPF0337 family)
MEWNAVEGSWKQVAATMKAKWSALTDADLEFVDRNKDALVARVRDRTGLEINTVERQLDALIASVQASASAVEKPAEPARLPPSGAIKTPVQG